jgi:hypothetical protein
VFLIDKKITKYKYHRRKCRGVVWLSFFEKEKNTKSWYSFDLIFCVNHGYQNKLTLSTSTSFNVFELHIQLEKKKNSKMNQG